MAVNRYYSSIAQDTTLSAPITSGALSMTVSATTGFPSQYPFILAVDWNTGTEELVVVTNIIGFTATITRGFDSSTPQAHNVGAVVRHVLTAQDMREAQSHVAGTTGVHGVTGAVVGTTDTQVLTHKDLTDPSNTLPVASVGASALTGTTLATGVVNSSLVTFGLEPAFTGPVENANIVAVGATGTLNINTNTSGLWYQTVSATANFGLNFRASAGTTLNTLLAIGQAVSVVVLNTNGATPYYANVFQVDGTATGVTVKWSGGAAPTAGNANSVDAYSFTILKTASATYTILAGGPVNFA